MIQKETALNEDYSQTYYRQWILTIGVIAAIVGFYWYQTHVYRPAPATTAAANAPTGNYFYVLRMPEVQVHADMRASRQQFSKWMEALEQEGFHFFLWTEVLRHLDDGIPLPEKTAVLIFDPGYRRTADTYMPVLEKKYIPAVWLTNGKAIGMNDKRFISSHVVQVMETSGLWNVGFYTADGAISLQTRDGQSLFLGRRSPWKPDTGRFALNRGTSLEAFDRLNINIKWTAEDLVHRLLVERPVQGPAILSLQQIQGKNWGIGLDMASTHDTHFTLRAPPDKRSGSLYWLGTAGLNDLHLRMEVKSLVGEMRLLLRSDQATGEDVAIVFGRGKVSVDKDKGTESTRLASVPCPDIAPNTPFTAVLAVMGRQLALAVNGHPLVALETLPEPTSSKGMIRLVVQDSLKGVGEARSVRIVCTPLGKNK